MLNFLKNFWPGLIWGCIILVLTLLPGNYFPSVGNFWNLFSPDKLVHLFIFGVLGFLLIQGNYRHYTGREYPYSEIAPILAAVMLGIVTEVLQAVLPIGREASIYDTVANFTGIMLGWAILSQWEKKKKKNLQTKAKNT